MTNRLHNLKNQTLGKKMILIIVGMLLAILIFLSLYLYKDSTSVLKNQAKTILKITSEKNTVSQNSSIQEIESTIFSISENTQFKDFIQRYATNQLMNDDESFDFQMNVLPMLRRIIGDSQKIASIEIFTKENSFYVTKKSLKTENYSTTSMQIPAFGWSKVNQDLLLDLPFNLFDRNMNKKGYIRIRIKKELIFPDIDNGEKNPNGMLLLDSNSQILYQTTKLANNQVFKQTVLTDEPKIIGNFVINQHQLLNNWQVITFFSMKNYQLNFLVFLRQVGLTGVVVLIIGIIFGKVLSEWLIRPIQRLNGSISKVGKNELPEIIPIFSNDEVGQLTASYNRLVLDMKDLFERNQLEEKAKHDAQLSAYQAQIQPHFLYNTLAIISWSAKKGDLELVERITQNLAKYYRLVLAKGKRIATLKEELDLVYYYLEIQKIRFPEQLKATIIVDPTIDSEKLFVMHRILQPIVENALEHGILPKGEGEIVVEVTQDSRSLFIHINDNGVGTEEEVVRFINSAHELVNNKGSFSLSSIVQALNSYYRSAVKFQFNSIPNQGTSVEIIIEKAVMRKTS